MNNLVQDDIEFIIKGYIKDMQEDLAALSDMQLMDLNDRAFDSYLSILKFNLENIEKWKRIKFGMIKANKTAIIEFKDTSEQPNNDVYIPESPGLL